MSNIREVLKFYAHSWSIQSIDDVTNTLSKSEPTEHLLWDAGRKAKEALANDNWKPINTAPKSERILVTNGSDTNTSEFTDILNEWIMSPQLWVGDGDTGEIARLEFTPTHWQLLPEPPKKEI